MSSFRTLVFKALDQDESWSSTSHGLTLLVRRVPAGYVASLQKWSSETDALVTESITADGRAMVFATREAAETACQVRYEQELRWTYGRSR